MHLEGRRSVDSLKLSFKPVRASRAEGFQGPYGGSQLVPTLYRIDFFCFQMCNRLPEMMKNGGCGDISCLLQRLKKTSFYAKYYSYVVCSMHVWSSHIAEYGSTG